MSSETRLTNEKLLKISVSILGLTAIGFLITMLYLFSVEPAGQNVEAEQNSQQE